MALAKTRYVRSGEDDIAYQVIGEAAHDVVLSFDFASHLEEVVAHPQIAEFVAGIARFARVLLFDMRGVGMSGGVASASAALESWMDDVVAVMDVTGSARATLMAHGHAAQMAMMTAAAYPDRVASLVLVNGWARFARADDYPLGLPAEAHESILRMVEEQWGTGDDLAIVAPSMADRPGVREWWGRVERYSAPPSVARARMQAVLDLDVRDFLPLIQAPTLVVHSRENAFVRVGHGRYLAENIPGAELVEVDSSDHQMSTFTDFDLVGLVEERVTGSRADASAADRVLATVLFVDIVSSTQLASEAGDERWRSALGHVEHAADEAISLYEGTLERHTGDGVLATFDGPARAIRCAVRICEEALRGGVEVRCGLHAGEVIRRPEGLAGLAVHIGARICDLAAPGEVLATRTVRDLVAGSGIAFEERGAHALKGVPDTWALYAVSG
jgi:class 3 adenylate cyclase/pimeloyl-ACP methyl ester carboxylesterase